MAKGQSLAVRFDNRCIKGNGCWEWTGSKDGDGYGVIWTKETNNNQRAHRVSLRLHGVDVPKDKMVLHQCDNPSCVNPQHLTIGDNKQNQKEAVERGLTGDLSAKRKAYIKSLSEEEWVIWQSKCKSNYNLTTAIKWRQS